jgi:eukaryotic-like serine/threonine-protein kinase
LGDDATLPADGEQTEEVGAKPREGSSAVETLAGGDAEPGSSSPRSHPRRGAGVLERGDAVGRYLVVEMLGRGGMGVVYRAYDPDLDRAIALKMLRIESDSGSASDKERTRLLREAQAMARLSHPNVIAVHDVGLAEGAIFVAMEYVDGSTLRAWLTEQSRGWREVLAAYLQAGRGLAAAHAAGIVHRDFKPDNVMIERPRADVHEVGRVRVLDFGLARASGDPDAAETTSTDVIRSGNASSLDRSLTVEGAVLGTPAYMSPEQHVGANVGPLSDQFSFCVALYEALYGHRPFAGDTLARLAYAVTQGEIDEPRGGHDVPRFVHAAIVRGLSTKSVDRFPTMEALLDALDRDPRRTRRRWALGVGSIAVVAGVLAVSHGASAPPAVCTGADDRVRTIWNEERKEALARTFAGTHAPFADDVLAALTRAVDARASAWVEAHTRACRATRITGEQSEALLDLRNACLDRRLRELDAVLKRLSQADTDVVVRAVDAVERLEPVEACDDTSRLGARMGPPTDPDLAEAVAQREQGLADVVALLGVGDYDEAAKHIATIVDGALELDHPPLSARVLALQAEAQSNTGETRSAADTYRLALEQAIVAADDVAASDTARELAHVVGFRLAEHERGLEWLRVAQALLRRAGDDAAREATIAMTEGAILVGASKYDEAIAAHERGRRYWEEHDPNAASLARILDSIGAAERSRGNAEEAIALHRRALEIKRHHYGSAHPEVSATLRELANALGFTKAFAEALDAQQQVLEIERRARGERNERVAVVLDDIGRSLRNLGRTDEAIEHHRRALEIWREVLGDPHPSLAVSLLNIGYTLNAESRFAAALEEFEHALATVLASVGPEHAYAVYAHNAAASALIDLDRPEEALAHVEAVLALEGLQVDPTLVAETKFIGAHALWFDDRAPAPARARARTLALEAHEAYAAGGERWTAYREKIDRWLTEHPAP